MVPSLSLPYNISIVPFTTLKYSVARKSIYFNIFEDDLIQYKVVLSGTTRTLPIGKHIFTLIKQVVFN